MGVEIYAQSHVNVGVLIPMSVSELFTETGVLPFHAALPMECGMKIYKKVSPQNVFSFSQLGLPDERNTTVEPCKREKESFSDVFMMYPFPYPQSRVMTDAGNCLHQDIASPSSVSPISVMKTWRSPHMCLKCDASHSKWGHVYLEADILGYWK